MARTWVKFLSLLLTFLFSSVNLYSQSIENLMRDLKQPATRKKKIQDIVELGKLLKKEKMGENYIKGVEILYTTAKSTQEDKIVRYWSIASLALLKKMDNLPEWDLKRKELVFNIVRGKEDPEFRAEVALFGLGIFLEERKNKLNTYSEYIRLLKRLFYDRNENYMVRSNAAPSLAVLGLLSQEKEKAIKTLFEIMHSIPPAQKDSRFMGRVILSLQEITGEKYQSPEEWERWYKENFLKKLN